MAKINWLVLPLKILHQTTMIFLIFVVGHEQPYMTPNPSPIGPTYILFPSLAVLFILLTESSMKPWNKATYLASTIAMVLAKERPWAEHLTVAIYEPYCPQNH